MTETLTDEDKATLKTAAHGAVTLVSVAYPQMGAHSPGKIASAGARVLSGATGLTGQVINSKPYPKLPSGSTADMAAAVLPALTDSMGILRKKAPGEVDNFRRIVEIAVAQGADDDNAAQAEMISKVKAALTAET